jgi:hypothetical protein
MEREPVPLRISFLMYAGLGVGVLLVIAGTDLWKREFREGGGFLGLAAIIAFLFFRRRLFALSLSVLSVVIALFGMGAVSHRSALAGVIALGAMVIVYLLIRWDIKRNSARALGDWTSLLEKDRKP